MKAPALKKFDPVPEGNHVARLYQIIHIGTINNPYQGEDRDVDTLRLTFELCNEKKEFKEGEGEKPFSISQEYTFSMGKKSNLRKIAEGILGSLTDAEAIDVEIETLLGEDCLLNVIHREGKDGNTYANIAGASPLPKGISAPPIFNETKFIDVSTTPLEELDALPKFIVDKIHSSKEFGVKYLGKSEGEEINPNDIPF